MKYPLFSIRDIKRGFDFPNPDQSEQSAIRGFSYAVNKEDSLMGFAPKDYDLYKVGEFDIEKGVIIAEEVPVFIIGGNDVFGTNVK